jgi:class 3 adenylate cyclase/tetratricopeptide (TPR) repeat protein
MNCVSCGAPLSPEFRFCGGCGRAVEPVSDPWASASDRAGERRQLTIMFCDLVDSTPLAHRLDPEDLRDVTRDFQELCARTIQPFAGSIAQFLGDGILIYFGYPLAHEDDAKRAVSAALSLLDRLESLNRTMASSISGMRDAEAVRLRVGIHTGPVVVDDLGLPSNPIRLALGETVNIAARLQSFAQPDSLAISAQTALLLDDDFVLEDLGANPLKGIEELVQIHQVTRERVASERRIHAGPAPLVGRRRERDALLESFEAACTGSLETALLEGEAGIGKSHLAISLQQQLASRSHVWLECRCSHYHENSALFPVVGMLERAFQLGPFDVDDQRLVLLRRALEATEMTECIAPFASLLSLDCPESLQGPPLSAEAQRRRELEAVAAWLVALAEAQPVVVFVEDLHWVDPSTLELLSLVRERASGARLLLLCAFRPSLTSPWPAEGIRHILLGPLSPDDALEMARAVAGDRVFEGEFADLVARTDGVPLFVEELTKAVLEAAGDQNASVTSGTTIPSTLQDSLMARLDRLGSAKPLAQFASVIGRDFPFDVLARASGWEIEALDRGLARLVESELVVPQQQPGRVRAFAFKHSLIRDTAYASLLRDRRRECHALVAAQLEQEPAGSIDARPEVIGRHHREAGDARRSIDWYRRAGEEAFRRSAHSEAIDHYEEAIEQLPEVSSESERSKLELPLRIGMGATLVESRGYGSDEAAEAHARARELCADAVTGPELYQAIGGLYLFHQGRMEFTASAEMAAQLLQLGNEGDDPFVQQWGHFFSSVPLFYRGDFQGSRESLEHVFEYEYTGPTPDWFQHEHDLGVSAHAYAALALWVLGFPDQAERSMEAALRRARASSHPFNLAFALSWAALGHQVRREPALARERSDEAIAICEEQGFPAYHGLARASRGWAMIHERGDPAGIDELRAGLRMSAETGTRTEAPRAMALMAQSYQELERWDESLAAIAGGLGMSQRSHAPYWDAELLRLRDEALWRRAGEEAEDAGSWFERAIEVARDQQARCLELRAALSMASFLETSDRRADAQLALEGIVDFFEEGDDPPDLLEARSLLTKWRE